MRVLCVWVLCAWRSQGFGYVNSGVWSLYDTANVSSGVRITYTGVPCLASSTNQPYSVNVVLACTGELHCARLRGNHSVCLVSQVASVAYFDGRAVMRERDTASYACVLIVVVFWVGIALVRSHVIWTDGFRSCCYGCRARGS